MSVLLSNNASSVIASSITSSSTTIILAAGQGVEFPSPGATDYFYATLLDSSNNLEIVKVTARSTDTLTVVRGQDGTSARAYTAGDLLELRLVAGVLNDVQTTINSLQTTINSLQTAVNNVQGVPSGSVFWFAASAAPTGYLYCNGAAISRTTYAALFAIVGTTYGVGDGSTTFNLPELRGEFIRGYNNQPSAGLDPGRVFGSLQTDIIKNHTHPASTTASDAGHNHGYVTLSGGGGSSFAGGAQGTTTATTDIGFASISASTTISNNTGGSATETRPVNMALLPCIKT
jgi:microcystin-dependent protein